MIDKEYILCAAIRRLTPRDCQPYYNNDICNIEIGYRHHDIYQRFNYTDEETCPLSFKQEDQGFYTSKGRYVDRYEGMEIAYNAGQVDEYRALDKEWTKCELFTEKEITYNYGTYNQRLVTARSVEALRGSYTGTPSLGAP